MADKTNGAPNEAQKDHPGPFAGDYNPYAPGNYDVGGFGFGGTDKTTPKWTDGFPHDFRGWGPQTPLPDSEDLSWRSEGEDDDRDHVVWRFEPKHH
jgi:hypothetical protein